eukprot:8352173-Pyramimonas_sp.AAC.2
MPSQMLMESKHCANSMKTLNSYCEHRPAARAAAEGSRQTTLRPEPVLRIHRYAQTKSSNYLATA